MTVKTTNNELLKGKMKTIATQTKSPAGWDDDDLEVDFLFKNDSASPDEFNTLYGDNRGRFFLARTGGITDPFDMPGTAFHQVDLLTALEWNLAVLENPDATSMTGTNVALVRAALQALREKN